MSKDIIFSNLVHDKIRIGINKLTNAVKVTLGPTGRVVMIERDYGNPYITKDGVTVAKEVELPDRFENMGAQMVKQVAAKTAQTAGDGTTTATIYTQAIYEAGLKSVVYGAKPQSIKRGIDLAVTAIVNSLASSAKRITSAEEIKRVAICSANHDEMVGDIITQAIEAVGRDGVVTIEDGVTAQTCVNVVEGLRFNRGYLGPHFITDPKTNLCEYENPAIAIYDYRINSVKQIMPLLEQYARSKNASGLVLIAEDIEGEALATMSINNLRGVLHCVAIKAPDFGDRRREVMDDIAIAVGATVISRETISLDKVALAHLGSCKKITIDKDTTTIIEGSGDQNVLLERIENLKNRLAGLANDFDREKLQERIARLAGGIAVISVGGVTETEIREKRDRIDDALNACKAALDEGILPGGGIAPIYAARCLDNIQVDDEDVKAGINIIKKAVEAPLRQIAANTGLDPGAVLHQIASSDDQNYGFEAQKGVYGDMCNFGVLVPAKVERVSLQHAASIAGLLLTTDCMISTIQEAKLPDPMV